MHKQIFISILYTYIYIYMCVCVFVRVCEYIRMYLWDKVLLLQLV